MQIIFGPHLFIEFGENGVAESINSARKRVRIDDYWFHHCIWIYLYVSVFQIAGMQAEGKEGSDLLLSMFSMGVSLWY